jgi:ubiquinone/menaquinone biosynthesis C-methylase UbiE
MAIWDRAELAATYRDVRGVSANIRRTWSDAFRAALPDARPRRSLDLGCGTGRFTALLAETFGGTVIGLDASVAMLKERPSSGGVPGTVAATGGPVTFAAADASASVAFAAADAGALPLRAHTMDLALLSMVYHLLVSPAVTAAELHRVLDAGGAVLVRTPTREILDGIAFLRFFPAALAIDEARMPPRAALEALFHAGGFTGGLGATIEQEFAPTPAAAHAKVSRRPFSSLQLMSDDAFAEGLTRFEAFCRTAPVAPIADPLDLFVFRRA